MASNCIGLDIGSSSVKLVQLKETRKGLILRNFGINPLLESPIADGAIINQVAVLEAIEALFSRLELKKKDVSLAISGRNVIVKKILMPIMNKTDLEEELAVEMVHHIPFDKDEVEVDYEVVVPSNSEGQMEVLLVASKKEIVEDYLDVVREAGLNPVVLDVASFAVQNIIERTRGIDPNESYVILNIGASSTSINVVINGITTFVRDIGIGGNSITGEIRRSMQITLDEAETKKREAASGMSPDKELMKIVTEVCNVMAGEIQRSIDFFLSTVNVKKGVKIIVTGGGALMNPLISSIENKSNMVVEKFDGFARGIIVDESKFDMPLLQAQASTASVALGLALRKPGDWR
ncbi:MAG: type IV pilus assembly protein PilM [Deltaproteobacteria bacterium]|jgi:type IV pilus assembly protein PilM|nr:type IV pilus assembly protein PilM [Deltaproteobacteria bacterium]